MRIVNASASARLSIRLDLAEICHEFINCELGRRASSTLTIHGRGHKMRTRKARGPPYSVRLADTGGLRISGKYLPEDLRVLMKRVVRRIQTNVDSRVRMLDFKLMLFTVTHEIGMSLSMMKLASLPGAQASEMDSFDRVTLHCRTVPVNAAVFSSGRMLLYARRYVEDVRTALDELLPMLRSCPREHWDMSGPSALPIINGRCDGDGNGAGAVEYLDGDESVASVDDFEDMADPDFREGGRGRFGAASAEETLVGGLVPRAWLGAGSAHLHAPR